MEISIDPNRILSCYESVLKEQESILNKEIQKWKEKYTISYKQEVIDYFENKSKHWFYKFFVTKDDINFIKELKEKDAFDLLFNEEEYRGEDFVGRKYSKKLCANSERESKIDPIKSNISLVKKIKKAAVHAQNSGTFIKLSNHEIELFENHITYEPYR